MKEQDPNKCGRQGAARGREESTAFTLMELLVVLAVIGILASLLLPALSRARAAAQGIACLSNNRQLDVAWLMYADDHRGWLPYNAGGASGRRVADQSLPLNWVNGVLDWELTPDNTNLALLVGGSLAPYLSQSANLYRCPADHVLSAPQKQAGWDHRVRSYSMNAMMGNAEEASRAGFNLNNPDYQQFFNLSSVPQPVKIFVFLGEHPDSIDDGYFINNGESREWIDLPASYHNGSGSFAFADGHAEMHRWRYASTQPPPRPDAAALPLAVAPDQAEDFEWVVDRMSAERTGEAVGGLATP